MADVSKMFSEACHKGPSSLSHIHHQLFLRVNLRADLLVPDAPSPHIREHVKRVSQKSRPHSLCGNTKTLHTGQEQNRRVLWLLAFSRESSSNCPCIALLRKSYRLESNLRSLCFVDCALAKLVGCNCDCCESISIYIET